jgi:hypothetical protein
MANLTLLKIGDLEVAFSYNTVVAFQKADGPWVISENVWSQTTGRHLSWLPGGSDKKNRMPYSDFQIALKEATS